ncbi:MAG: hypothetical protein R3C02_05440 [Planctomycetaceae bacterium]
MRPGQASSNQNHLSRQEHRPQVVLLYLAKLCLSLGLVAFVTLLGSLSSQQSFAQENSSLTDEGLSQIVTDEVSDRLATYLNANSIQTVNTVVVEGKFHSLTNEILSRQLTNSLKGHEIV